MDNLGFFFLFMFLAIILAYFFPTIVAIVRRKRNWGAIFALNLLAGWAFIGWIGALVWARTHDFKQGGKKELPPAPIEN